eukprot:jgi/Mesvir1/277/Mv13612-RA.1
MAMQAIQVPGARCQVYDDILQLCKATPGCSPLMPLPSWRRSDAGPPLRGQPPMHTRHRHDTSEMFDTMLDSSPVWSILHDFPTTGVS